MGNYSKTLPAHRLKTDSTAIDTGKNLAADPNTDSLTITTNGRGLPRRADLSDSQYPYASDGDGSDIGAYEYQLPPTAATGIRSAAEVLTAVGSGLMNDRVILTEPSGNARTVIEQKERSFSF